MLKMVADKRDKVKFKGTMAKWPVQKSKHINTRHTYNKT